MILSATYAKDQSFLLKAGNVIWLVKEYSATENEIAAIKELKIIQNMNLIYHMKYRKKTQQNTIRVAMDLMLETMLEIHKLFMLFLHLYDTTILNSLFHFFKALTFGIQYLFYILRITHACFINISFEKKSEKNCV